ncbi:uncharacterized protein LOC116126138 [Pistacia vera]|uniref:uncharacterized protein LOC116126138 n=1 Tax=Pistacia vera TaxID=55513 RepID=UPI001262C9E1|nr:uncharacterized protein LOC116126138 [Pistacia vera]
MGCCISSNKTKNSPNHHHFPSKTTHSDKTHVNNRPPPPCLEEETVKEVVLSETRLPKPQSPSPKETEADTLHHIHIPVIHEHHTEAKDLILINKHHEEIEISQASQVSEIYSVTESFSSATTATTTTITEKREDEAISKPTTRRSPAKVPRRRPYTGEISRGVKPPADRAGVSKSAQGRTMPRNVRSTGERGSSVRRSRSPETRTVAGVGRSAGKVGGGGSDRLREEKEVKKEVNDGVLEKNNNMVESNESLDNPHVSLECFIFL